VGWQAESGNKDARAQRLGIDRKPPTEIWEEYAAETEAVGEQEGGMQKKAEGHPWVQFEARAEPAEGMLREPDSASPALPGGSWSSST